MWAHEKEGPYVLLLPFWPTLFGLHGVPRHRITTT